MATLQVGLGVVQLLAELPLWVDQPATPRIGPRITASGSRLLRLGQAYIRQSTSPFLSLFN
jgi:hypothetical protein